MASSTEIVIGDTSAQHVLIRPLSRSLPGLFEKWDGNWIDCEIQVMAGAFQGTVRADLRSEEFQTFLEDVQDLDRTFEGAASFTSMEGQFAVTLGGDERGQVRVTGEAIDEPGAGNRLQFRFVIERQQLADLSQALEHLLAAFPVVATPEA
jgi:hypothetical protein